MGTGLRGLWRLCWVRQRLADRPCPSPAQENSAASPCCNPKDVALSSKTPQCPERDPKLSPLFDKKRKAFASSLTPCSHGCCGFPQIPHPHILKRVIISTHLHPHPLQPPYYSLSISVVGCLLLEAEFSIYKQCDFGTGSLVSSIKWG